MDINISIDANKDGIIRTSTNVDTDTNIKIETNTHANTDKRMDKNIVI